MKSKLLGLALFAPFVLYACSDSKDSANDTSGDDDDTTADSGSVTGDDTTGDDSDGSTSSGDSSTLADGAPSGTNPIEGATVEKIDDGGGFMDGIQWIPALNAVTLADFNNGVFFSTGPGAGASLYAATNPIAVALENNGKVLISEASPSATTPHRILRVTVSPDAGPTMTVVTDVGPGGKKYHQPNDIATRKDGNFYFTDPNYFNHLPPVDGGVSEYLAYEGVFRVTAAGVVSLVDSTQLRPNGIALSADGNTLFVGNDKNVVGVSGVTAGPSSVVKYAVAADGSINGGVAVAGTKFADTAAGVESIAVDDNGNVYVAGLSGIEVFSATGTKWGTIAIPAMDGYQTQATSIGFGGADRKTLFIGANTSAAGKLPKLLKATVKVAGAI